MKILLLNAGAKDYGATQEILLTIQNEIPASESVSLICLGGKDLRVLKVGRKCYGIALRTGFRPFECEHIIDTIEHWCGHMGIEMAGSMFFCGINDREDIQQYKDLIREKTAEWISKSPAT